MKKSGVEVCYLKLVVPEYLVVRYSSYTTASQITDTILSPEVAFTGDTTAEYMLDPHNADALRAKILITEV